MAWTKTPLKPTAQPKYTVLRRIGPNGNRLYLEGEAKEKFIKLYPKHSNRRIMEWFGISFTTMHRFARELGLQKDMKAICKEHARDIKKICERNGYYDSIRGKSVSAACKEGARKKRAEGYHPLLHVKETNPKRYAKICQKRSENRKELIEKERLRILYGLPRQTKLRLDYSPLQHKAYAHKYQMIKECNYFAIEGESRNVYYDSQTKRSARREATATRHGLHVMQADEEEETITTATNEIDNQ